MHLPGGASSDFPSLEQAYGYTQSRRREQRRVGGRVPDILPSDGRLFLADREPVNDPKRPGVGDEVVSQGSQVGTRRVLAKRPI